ncbi:matrix protein [Sowthistle yellow vein virus]|uniref:Matrix protein n=1 Tax=Sowthistle yellow vein virus TaxID=2358214 RepID=A0AAE7AFU9_9RHAB|nr:matrix protein [Sowthistle yellow vein virus]QJQ80125.1 matrix protein [Sowthistle yellow vein virus]
MEPATFNIKGTISLTFPSQKEGMDASKIWTLVSKIWSLYPKKIQLFFSAKRGLDKGELVSDKVTIEAIKDLISGSISTLDIHSASGSSMSLYLGACHDYRVPFGVRSSDVGHDTIIFTLPFPLEGCYTASARFDGSIKRDTADREHYMMSIELEIYIGKVDMIRCEELIKTGYKVYPFKIMCPQYFQSAEMSESEFTTDASDEEETPEVSSYKSPRKVINNGIIKRIAKPTEKRNKMRTKTMLNKLGLVSATQNLLGEIPPANLLNGSISTLAGPSQGTDVQQI